MSGGPAVHGPPRRGSRCRRHTLRSAGVVTRRREARRWSGCARRTPAGVGSGVDPRRDTGEEDRVIDPELSIAVEVGCIEATQPARSRWSAFSATMTSVRFTFPSSFASPRRKAARHWLQPDIRDRPQRRLLHAAHLIGSGGGAMSSAPTARGGIDIANDMTNRANHGTEPARMVFPIHVSFREHALQGQHSTKLLLQVSLRDIAP